MTESDLEIIIKIRESFRRARMTDEDKLEEDVSRKLVRCELIMSDGLPMDVHVIEVEAKSDHTTITRKFIQSNTIDWMYRFLYWGEKYGPVKYRRECRQTYFEMDKWANEVGIKYQYASYRNLQRLRLQAAAY